jgi:hypothetical protein
LTSYPLLAGGDVALFNVFLLHHLIIGPRLQLRVVNSWAFGSKIQVGRSILGSRIGRRTGGIGILGGGGATRDYQHQSQGQG